MLEEATAQEIEFILGQEPAFPEREEITPEAEVRVPPEVSPKPRRVRRPPPKFPELELEELYEVPPVRPRRKRRRLIFIDEETQLSADELRAQVQDIHIDCRRMVLVEAVGSRTRRRTPAELLRNPTYPRWIPPELRRLWARCANVERVDYAQRRREEAEEEEEEEEERPEAEPSRDYFPSEERIVAEEGLEPSIAAVISAEISLEVSEEERARILPSEERPPEPRPLPALEEEVEGFPELPLEAQNLTEDLLLRIIGAKMEDEETDFATVVPPFIISRKIASKAFALCLDLAGRQVLLLKQEEAYGQILIRPGPHFPEHLLKQ
ncbi:meiotic recombination protein REC8 homolog [Latimeria chalumnae]|uniref:meiotic recombination protein REC8 homolog n=1 Tax=Latimeria chalumnae TaxID=7897 RepID=UPI00313BE0B8